MKIFQKKCKFSEYGSFKENWIFFKILKICLKKVYISYRSFFLTAN